LVICSPFSIKNNSGSIPYISDNSGNLAAEYSYDVWGRMRNPVNWYVYAQGSQPAMLHGERGYTGHEQLNQFGPFFRPSILLICSQWLAQV